MNPNHIHITEKEGESHLADTVLYKIRHGEIQMKPKSRFLLELIGLFALLTATLITSIFLASFIFFSLEASGKFFLLGFGLKGIEVFFLTFPWGMLFLEFILLFLLDSVITRFRFAYSSPLIYIFIGTSCLIIASGFILSMTSFHPTLSERQQEKGLPVMGGFYTHARGQSKEQGIFKGVVERVESNRFVLLDSTAVGKENFRQTITVPYTVDARSLVSVGDRVFVAGDIIEGNISAYGIKKLLNGQ